MRELTTLLLLLTLCGCDQPLQQNTGFQVAESLGGITDEGFARATAIRPFHFPRDHGPHPNFRNEWWYITGNLHTGSGRAFGFQITFFRIALKPGTVTSPSAWRTSQIWMAHAALTDLSNGRHFASERFARQGIGLAGAQTAPLRVWLEDWRLQADEENNWQLQLATDEFVLQLKLSPQSPIIFQGDKGLSQKSSAPGSASYYYSIPRLKARGQLRIQDKPVEVEGLAWLDREWSTSALGPEQQGWDWFSLQLQDGRNLMYYQLRRKDDTVDPFSSGSISDSRGLTQRLKVDDISLTPLTYWNGAHGRYPIEWRLQLQGEPHAWRVRALLPDQEMRLSVHYWEGAIEISNEQSGEILGRGFLEMTGYNKTK